MITEKVPVGVPIPLPPAKAEKTVFLNKDEDKFMREFEQQQLKQKEVLEQKAMESRSVEEKTVYLRDRRRKEVLRAIGPEKVRFCAKAGSHQG